MDWSGWNIEYLWTGDEGDGVEWSDVEFSGVEGSGVENHGVKWRIKWSGLGCNRV